MFGVVGYVPCRFSDRVRGVRHAVVKTNQVSEEIMYESPTRFACAQLRFEAERSQLSSSQRAQTEATHCSGCVASCGAFFSNQTLVVSWRQGTVRPSQYFGSNSVPIPLIIAQLVLRSTQAQSNRCAPPRCRCSP